MANKVKLAVSTKQAQVIKAQSSVLATITVATVVTIFCLMSAKALVAQAAYQRKVINANHAASKQLQANVAAAKLLTNQYNSVFEGGSPNNIIDGKNDTSQSATPPNGDNARIVLDALPSQYDFPALVSSLSLILNRDSITDQSVTGTDEATTVSNVPSNAPQPQQIQVTIAGTGTAAQVQAFLKDLERSIRPFDVAKLQLSGPENTLVFSVDVNTYYQPAKALTFTTKEIK